MRESMQKHKGKSPAAMRIAASVDPVAICPKCGGEIGLWSEARETRCIFCDYRVFEKERMVH